MTHSSFANESPQVSPRDNERLEYLGDAVLQLITAEYLFKMHPDAKEGELTQVRSAMVNTNTLAALAEGLGLGEFLYLGRGIAKGGGRALKSLLANAFEAVLGAVFLDAGYDAAYHYYLDRFRRLPAPVQDENYKGRLQQLVQERMNQTPYYDSVGARGGRHREYTAVVYAGSEPLGTGHGATKQAAEQDAARNALAELERRELERRAGRRRRGRRPEAAAEPQPAHEVEQMAATEPTSAEKGAASTVSEDGEPKPRQRRRRRLPGPAGQVPEVTVAAPAEEAAAPQGELEPQLRPARRRRRSQPSEVRQPEPSG